MVLYKQSTLGLAREMYKGSGSERAGHSGSCSFPDFSDMACGHQLPGMPAQDHLLLNRAGTAGSVVRVAFAAIWSPG